MTYVSVKKMTYVKIMCGPLSIIDRSQFICLQIFISIHFSLFKEQILRYNGSIAMLCDGKIGACVQVL